MDPSHVQKNGVNQHQQQMMWSGAHGPNPAGGSVSVVTTVYPGAVSGGYHQSAYDQSGYVQQTPGQKTNGYASMAPGGMHVPGSMAYRTSNPAAIASGQPAYVGARGIPAGPQYGGGPGPPGRAAMNAAKVAAAAVATATATAVAYENSQQIQSHEYDGQQV